MAGEGGASHLAEQSNKFTPCLWQVRMMVFIFANTFASRVLRFTLPSARAAATLWSEQDKSLPSHSHGEV